MPTELPEQYMLRIQKEIDISAPPAVVWEAMLEQIGPGFDRPDGQAMPMKLEAWPGGRLYRDMGNSTGHFWAHVQVIKPPTLLELTGPMFMSYPVMSHVQYRLAEQGGITKLTITHRAMGDIAVDHREGVGSGWTHIANRIKARSTAARQNAPSTKGGLYDQRFGNRKEARCALQQGQDG